MTFLEAINSIEKVVAKAGIRYKDGEPVEPVVAFGKIARFHGDRFDRVIEDLDNSKITVDAYYFEMIKMVKEYQTRPRDLGVWN